MWTVRNRLRGTLTFRGLGISIPPKGEVDLDALLGRERAESSNQIQVAFEEGYLQTIRKEAAEGASDRVLEARLESFKASLKAELASLRSSLAGDMRDLFQHLKVAKLRLHEEKERVLVDSSLTEGELKARLAFLDEQEREIEKNFSEIGRKSEAARSGASSLAEKADLLSRL